MDRLAALPEIDLPSSSFQVEVAGQERRLISSLRRPHSIEARSQGPVLSKPVLSKED